MFDKKINLLKNDLTKLEIVIADYLLSTPFDKSLTSYKLAQILNMGQATVIRFSKTLGYSSFTELLIDLGKYASEPSVSEIDVHESMSETNEKIMNQYHDVINLTHQINDILLLEKAINHLYVAKTIIIYGKGSSFLMAEYFANQLMKIGLNAFISNDYDITLTKINQSGPIDLCFIISDQGKSLELLRLAKLTITNKIPLITLTKANTNKLQSFSNINLKTINYDENSRLKSMSMRFSQLCVLDMLYLNLIKKDYQRFQGNIDSAHIAVQTVNQK